MTTIKDPDFTDTVLKAATVGGLLDQMDGLRVKMFEGAIIGPGEVSAHVAVALGDEPAERLRAALLAVTDDFRTGCQELQGGKMVNVPPIELVRRRVCGLASDPVDAASIGTALLIVLATQAGLPAEAVVREILDGMARQDVVGLRPDEEPAPSRLGLRSMEELTIATLVGRLRQENVALHEIGMDHWGAGQPRTQVRFLVAIGQDASGKVAQAMRAVHEGMGRSVVEFSESDEDPETDG